MHTRALAVVLVAVSALFGGCGAKGPADALGPTLRALGEPGGPTVPRTRLLYESLDVATRSAVDQRAKALGEALGRPVDADEVIQFRGFDPNVRVSAIEVEQHGEDRARIEVSLARIGATEGLMPEPVSFEAVLEDGAWKLSMPQLAAEVEAK